MDPTLCKLCGGDLSVFAHTATCGACGALLYYPYPSGSDPALTDKQEELRWYGRSAAFNHVNFPRMLRYASAGAPPLAPLAVLDYGGGGGQFAVVCRSHFPRATVYLVDINDDSAIEEWKPFNRRILFRDFAADGTRFDLIFLNDVLEHLNDPLGALRQIAGKLKEGGRIFIDTPRQFWIYPLTRLLSRSLHVKVLRGTVTPLHQQIWSERAFRIAVGASGLTVLKSDTWAEFTMPPEFYLDNMRVTNGLVRWLGRAMYRSAGLLLRNKLVCVLGRPQAA